MLACFKLYYLAPLFTFTHYLSCPKNANSASALAAAEVAELKRAKDEAFVRVNQVEEALLTSEERCKILQSDLEKVQIQVSQLKNDHAIAVAAEKTASVAAESALAQLMDAKEALAESINRTLETRLPTDTMSTFDPDVEEKAKDHNDADISILPDRKRIVTDVYNIQQQNDSSHVIENSTTPPPDDAIVTEMKRQECDDDNDRDAHEQRKAKNRSLRRTVPSGEHPSSDKLMLVNEVMNTIIYLYSTKPFPSILTLPSTFSFSVCSIV